mgnify:CR=1 FL=1
MDAPRLVVEWAQLLWNFQVCLDKPKNISGHTTLHEQDTFWPDHECFPGLFYAISVLAEPQLCIPLLAQPKYFGWARTLWPCLKQHALIPPFH